MHLEIHKKSVQGVNRTGSFWEENQFEEELGVGGMRLEGTL